MFGTASSSKPSYNPSSDVEVTTPPDIDGISSVNFSPTANHLVATSWNNKAYVWDVAANGQTNPLKCSDNNITQPLLCSSWNSDGSGVFLGGCDKAVKLWNLQTGAFQQVAAHDAPIRHCFWIPNHNLLATGGWDKTLRYWDCRAPTPALQQSLPERVYAMDVNYPLLVVGTADRHIVVYDLTKPQQPYKSLQSPLKWQTRCVACFPDKSGYLIGSIEGRVAVQHVDDSQAMQQKNFTFKCHRENQDIYAVNSISFHPVHGTFVTAGADGTYNFWDKDSKQRLKQMPRCMYGNNQPAPIPCGGFNRDGSIYAYAVSYDWSKGYAEYNTQTMKNVILLHQTKEDEVKAKPKRN